MSDYTCPYDGCDYESSERGVKIHHSQKHGESLAGFTKPCVECGEEFWAERRDRKSCSVECADKNKVTKREVNCANCGEEFMEFVSELARVNNTFCDGDCRAEYFSGERHHNYNGGSDKFFHTDAGQAWRKAVYERDDYTCQDCGNDSGGNLQAHHIKHRENCDNFEKHAVWNGVALCKSCHAERHKGEHVYHMMKSNIDEVSV